VRLLLATEKVDVNASDSYGATPIIGAAIYGHEGVVRLLLATGRVDLEAKYRYGGVSSGRGTALFFALRGHHTAIAQLLREYGAKVPNSNLARFYCFQPGKKVHGGKRRETGEGNGIRSQSTVPILN
jgi:ankyrin repeat protein